MNNLSTWLKDTIPGIIILGAIGSIVAVFLLGVLKQALTGVMPDIKKRLQALVDWWLDHPFMGAVKLFGNAKPYAVQAFFAFELAKLVAALFLAGCTLAMFFLTVQPPLTQWLLATFSFIFASDALKAFLRIFSYAIVARNEITPNLLNQVYGEVSKEVANESKG